MVAKLTEPTRPAGRPTLIKGVATRVVRSMWEGLDRLEKLQVGDTKIQTAMLDEMKTLNGEL